MEHPKTLWDSTEPDKRRAADEKLEKSHAPAAQEADSLQKTAGGRDAPPAPEN